jgi:hypothetical protein
LTLDGNGDPMVFLVSTKRAGVYYFAVTASGVRTSRNPIRSIAFASTWLP